MKFKKGRNRFVFVFPSLGIAIKLPIVHLLQSIVLLVKAIKRLHFKFIWYELAIPVSYPMGYKNRLFGGIVDNWSEFAFFCKTRNPFLQPTYFSFLGLINIQRVGKPCLLDATDFWCQLYGLTDGKVFDDCHHFENPDNFCFDKGKLKILDYGSKATHAVIVEFGIKIIESFDVSFDWDEAKRAGATK
jgi:hypothetical protein